VCQQPRPAAPLLPCRPIATLHDLQRHLCGQEGVRSFDELQLGPLLAQGRVVAEFSPAPTVTAIPEVRCGGAALLAAAAAGAAPLVALGWRELVPLRQRGHDRGATCL
jgi:hypothetical protein